MDSWKLIKLNNQHRWLFLIIISYKQETQQCFQSHHYLLILYLRAYPTSPISQMQVLEHGNIFQALIGLDAFLKNNPNPQRVRELWDRESFSSSNIPAQEVMKMLLSENYALWSEWSCSHLNSSETDGHSCSNKNNSPYLPSFNFKMYPLTSHGIILTPILWGRWDQDMILDGTLSRKVWTHLGTCHHFQGTSGLIRLYARIMIDPFIDILCENLQLPFKKMFRGYQVHVHRVKSGVCYIIGLDYGLAMLKQHLSQLPSFSDLHSGVNAAWLMHSQIKPWLATLGTLSFVVMTVEVMVVSRGGCSSTYELDRTDILQPNKYEGSFTL